MKDGVVKGSIWIWLVIVIVALICLIVADLPAKKVEKNDLVEHRTPTHEDSVKKKRAYVYTHQQMRFDQASDSFDIYNAQWNKLRDVLSDEAFVLQHKMIGCSKQMSSCMDTMLNINTYIK